MLGPRAKEQPFARYADLLGIRGEYQTFTRSTTDG